MCDFLVRCNNCDMKLFLKAQVEICKSEKIDMFKASVDLPGAAQCWLMVTSNKSRHVPGKSVWMDFLQDHTCSLREYLEDTIPIKNIHESRVRSDKDQRRPLWISGKSLRVGAEV